MSLLRERIRSVETVVGGDDLKHRREPKRVGGQPPMRTLAREGRARPYCRCQTPVRTQSLRDWKLQILLLSRETSLRDARVPLPPAAPSSPPFTPPPRPQSQLRRSPRALQILWSHQSTAEPFPVAFLNPKP
eukprot:6196207-Pleurochrysis_carterae.AAC.1